MPVASSSRRSLRETAHESIEDVGSAHTSRRRRVIEDDVDEDEDSQPRRKASKKGKERASKKAPIRNGNNSDPNSGEDDADDPDRIDIENFKNVPIPRELFAKMKGIKEDWRAIQNAGYKPAAESVRNVAISMTEIVEDNKDSEKASPRWYHDLVQNSLTNIHICSW
jgi:E3 SUMO-protein ligase NSE2